MIQTNDTWKRIALDPYHHTTFALILDGQAIPPSRIAAAPEITSALYTNHWGVGNVASSCITFTYLPTPGTTKPKKAAKVQMRCTIWPRDADWVLSDEHDNKIVTERNQEISLLDTQTITIGTWYINTRSVDTRGWVTMTCYDKMYRLDRYTVKKAAKKYSVTLTYPVTSTQILSLAERVTGLIQPTAPYLDEPSIDLSKDDVNEMTMREALGYVAAVNGTNLIADELGTKMVAVYYSAYNHDSPYIMASEDDINELVDETGERIVYYDEDSAAVFVGLDRAADLSLGDTLQPVTAVEVTGLDDESWKATAEETTPNGTTYTFNWPLSSGGVGIAQGMIDAMGWFVYTPWDGRSVLLDPCIQVGDCVIVDGVETVISDIAATCGGAYVADCGAAGDYEVAEEL